LSGVVQGEKSGELTFYFLKLQLSETSAEPKDTVSLYFASKSLYHKGKNNPTEDEQQANRAENIIKKDTMQRKQQRSHVPDPDVLTC